MRIIGAAEAGLSDIKADEECSAMVNRSAFSKIDTNVRSWYSDGMKRPSVSVVTFTTYIILVVTAYSFWSSVYVDSLNVLFAFDIHRQAGVHIHYAGEEEMTEPFVVSFETEHHFAPTSLNQQETATEKFPGKVLLWHQESLDFNFFPASQRIFSIYSLNEAMNQQQISVCNGYVFRKPFPRPCRSPVLHEAKCNGALPTCSASLCLSKDCPEESTHVLFSFDAHSEAHSIPEHWPKQHDLYVRIKNEDGSFTKVLLDTSDAIQTADNDATLSLEKLNAPFDINGTTLSLHEGIKEDSDMEAIAYSVISALLFSIWVFSTGTSDTPDRGSDDSRLGISDIFVMGAKSIGTMGKNYQLLDSLLNNLKNLRVTIIFNSSLSICVASIVAICYEVVNDTVFTFLGTELGTIFTNTVQLIIVALYTALGCVPFLLTGPILVGMMNLEKYEALKKRANMLAGFSPRSRAYLLVALRMCFEIQLISAFQIHIPPSAGIPFQNVVSFALGITLLVITGRDLTILHYDRNNRGTLYVDIVIWLTATSVIMYSTLAMTTPFLWSTQIADYVDILPLSTAITTVALLLGSILFSNRFSNKPRMTQGNNNRLKENPTKILF